MQTLIENFFLLSFDSKKNTFASWRSYPKFDYGLCGALLFELFLAERIAISAQREFVLNTEVKANELWIEGVLEKIAQKKWFETLFGKKHEKTLVHWLKVLKMESSEVKAQTKKSLKNKNIIGEKPVKLLGLEVSKTVFLQDTATLQLLKDKLAGTILGETVPDLQTFMLLRLLKAAKVCSHVFAEKTAEERKILENNLTLLFEKDEFSEAIKIIFKELRQEELEQMTDLLDTLSDAIAGIGDAMDSVGDGGGDGGGGDGGGGGD